MEIRYAIRRKKAKARAASSITEKGMTLIGSWSQLDDGRVTIEVSILGFPAVFTGRIEGNRLRLQSGNGRLIVYQRVE